jgi:DNA helicase-2/ATP-dependent DNA helicase PcrA
MAKRRFQLPGIQDLSKEQESVRALPLEGQHLIIGGPGTGKSVMALLRAKSLADNDKDYRFLVFNHLLMKSSELLFGKDLKNKQWQSWFLKLFETYFRLDIPRLAPEPGSKYRPPFDWSEIVRLCESVEINDETLIKPFLVIDEGQDMPPSFYQSIVALGFENLFVVADQNQQIVSGENSSRKDLEAALALAPNDAIELKENYRNGYAIARLARHFYTGDPASPPPNLPEPELNQVKKPLLFYYSIDQFERIINKILKVSRNNPRKLIGIICPLDKVREKYYSALNKVNNSSASSNVNRIGTGEDAPFLSTFKNGDKHQMHFDSGGIMVINVQSCKGLEFDTVFVADIDRFTYRYADRDNTKKFFYVMVSRAIEQVILLRQKNRGKLPIDEIMPTDAPTFLEIFNVE